jgi:hypothetical protein
MTTQNATIWDSAYAGALGGMLEGQTGTSTSATLYEEFGTAAAAFAIEVDSLIASAIEPPVTVPQAYLMRKLCRAWWKRRNVTGLSVTKYSSSGTYAAIAGGIVAAWTASRTHMQGSS